MMNQRSTRKNGEAKRLVLEEPLGAIDFQALSKVFSIRFVQVGN
jgi:hypothetical protein